MLFFRPGPVFCPLLGVSSDYAQPITGQVTEVNCPMIGQVQPELTWSKREKMDPGLCVSWQISKFCGMHKNCFSMAIL